MYPTIRSILIRGTIIAMLGFTAFGLGLVPKAAAGLEDKATVITFSTPVEVPGKVLPAGTYKFRLMDSNANRNIVQIFDRDEKMLYATILALPDYRLKPSDKTVIQFEERPSGEPPAIKAWYYPGDNSGVQFVYPHDRAVQLAKRTGQNVLSMNNNMQKNMDNATANPKISASDPGIQQLERTDVTGVGPEGQPVDLVIILSAKPAK